MPGACVGCGKEGSAMSCPTCTKLQLETTYFCDQECFKNNWDAHKLIHKKKRSALDDSHLALFANYPFTGSLRPAARKPQRLPPKLPSPDYATSGIPAEEIKMRNTKHPSAMPEADIPLLRESCILGRRALDLAASMMKPGTTGEQVDDALHEFIVSNGAYPSPLNYRNFPKSVCVSVNEVICHGIPDTRPFEEGDIVNVDVTVYYKGYHADLNETYYIGDTSKIDPDTKRLVQGAYDCIIEAIKHCKPGTLYREVGNIISKVPHYEKSKAVGTMKAGHVFTIEPMINLGDYQDTTWPDNWTAVTLDGKKSAQFEHTLLITNKGVEVLTARLADSPPCQWDQAPHST
eukprot:GEMP01045289.1.p1 GENE.GEMP01045289.1~~GEMP01045289.1.p1  ORF type:complete len:347 (+),score=59.60 GEMP01045289.1:61-1101(+)